MEIRPATERDKPLWLEVRRALWPLLSKEAHDQAISGLLSKESSGCFLVFHQDGVRMGYVEGRLLDPTARKDSGKGAGEGAEGGTGRIGVIESWYILPKFRQSDIGMHLLRAVESWFHAQGCTEVRSDGQIGTEAGYKPQVALPAGERVKRPRFSKKLSAEAPENAASRMDALARFAEEQDEQDQRDEERTGGVAGLTLPTEPES